MHRLLVAAGGGLHLTDHRERLRAGRVEQRGDEILGERFVEPVLRAIDLAEIEVCVGVVGRELDPAAGTPRRRVEIELVVLNADR